MQVPSTQKNVSYQFLLDEAKRRFDEWRSQNGGGGTGKAIPNELWQNAINLLKFVPLNEVSRTLGIDAGRLKYKSEHGVSASMESHAKKSQGANVNAKAKVKKETKASEPLKFAPVAAAPQEVTRRGDNQPILEMTGPSGVVLRIYSMEAFAGDALEMLLTVMASGGYRR